MTETEPLRIAFVCVRNAGRSQMAHAFAERERRDRGLERDVEFVTGGTHPADDVHPGVVEVMAESGIDIADRSPREVTFEELQASDFVITMGCSAADVCPAGWTGNSRDWDLDDPEGLAIREVAKIRDEIERRVRELFAELERLE